ncbi:MAG: hypothetical protein JWN89_624 [Parcubacteria group bacterium]|nr:hypothetical protein [Parcubacteria group bacterium]
MRDTKTLLVSLSIIALFFVSLLGYAVYDLRGKNQETSLLVNAADASARSTDSALSLRTAKNNSEAAIAELDTSILTEGELVPLIEEIEKTGKDLGLKTSISSVTVDKVDPTAHGNDPDKVHVALEAEGPWAGSIAFIHALQNLPTKISIDDVSIISGTSSGVSPTGKPLAAKKIWRLQAALTVYLFKP